MEEKIKRPPSVWGTQIFILLWSLALFLAWTYSVISAIRSLGYYGLSVSQVIFPVVKFFLITLASVAPFLILGAVASLGLLRRKRYGRWTGVGLMTLLFISFVVGTIFRPSGPLPYYEYENARQAAAGMMTQIVMFGLFAFLIYRLAFGSAANAFFAKPTPDE